MSCSTAWCSPGCAICGGASWHDGRLRSGWFVWGCDRAVRTIGGEAGGRLGLGRQGVTEREAVVCGLECVGVSIEQPVFEAASRVVAW